jgi:hypothetical protein
MRTETLNLFENWLNGIDKKTKARIHIGVCALLWAIWNCKNDVIFYKASNAQFLQVIHKDTYWITHGPISYPRTNGFIWILLDGRRLGYLQLWLLVAF